MKLIALLVGLAIERLATQLFHLRELRWLDRVIDFGCDQARRFGGIPAIVSVLLLALLLVLPVAAVVLLLGDTLLGFPYLLLAIVVLFFSLGPKDIGEEVDDYCQAVEADDAERVRQTAKAFLEHDVPDDPWQRIEQVEQAVFVQANNRLFAVIFWFVLFGPLGAWSYRVTDLVRRRAVFNASRDAADAAGRAAADKEEAADDAPDVADAPAFAEAAKSLHSWLAWVPARLAALGYALAGSFDGGLAAWRSGGASLPAGTGEQSERLLGRVGVAALALAPVEDEHKASRAIRGAGAANRLVLRVLFLWAVIIAGMTLYGWSVVG